MIDDLMTIAVKLGGQYLFGDGHAHAIGNALAQGTGGGLDTRCIAVFRMTRGLGMQLAEVLEFFHGQVVTREMQQRIQQHRAVAIGQYETIAVRPFRISGIVFQIIVPENLRDVGHAHGRAGMAASGLLHRIHRQRAYRVGQVASTGYCLLGFR